VGEVACGGWEGGGGGRARRSGFPDGSEGTAGVGRGWSVVGVGNLGVVEGDGSITCPGVITHVDAKIMEVDGHLCGDHKWQQEPSCMPPFFACAAAFSALINLEAGGHVRSTYGPHTQCT